MAAKRKYTRSKISSDASKSVGSISLVQRLKRIISSVFKFLFGSKKRIAAIVLIAIAAIFVVRRFTTEPTGITTEKVVRKTLKQTVSANGEIKARSVADLKFFSPGTISWLDVKEGDKVTASVAIAKLDTTSLNASYKQTVNNLRNYQAIADSVLDSVQGHETDETFAQRATRTTAEVNRDNAYESIVVSRDSLGESLLASPIDGTVVDINNLVPGLRLSGADLESKFIRVVDMGSLYFEAQLDEIDYESVYVGQEVDVSVDAYPNNACKGKVISIAKEGEETTGGVIVVPVEIEIDRCFLNLVTGFNGEARFITSKKENTLVISKKYLVEKDGTDHVWLQTGISTRERKLVPVEIEIETPSEVEIVSGLKENDTIIFIPQG